MFCSPEKLNSLIFYILCNEHELSFKKRNLHSWSYIRLSNHAIALWLLEQKQKYNIYLIVEKNKAPTEG